MATTTDITPVIRALNAVKSNGQARAAGGAALNYIHSAYDRVSEITYFGDVRENTRRALDTARAQLESTYATVPADDVAAVGPEWGPLRAAIQRAYIEGAGAEGAAGYEPKTSNWTILADAIADAPRVFASAVGSVARGAGDVVGSAAGGLLGGLGWLAPVLLLIVVAVVALRFGGLSLITGML